MSCGQIPAACPALIWGKVMRIMSKEGWGSLALVQLGPTAPWDTGQAGRAQGALITRSVHPKGRERKQGEAMMMDEGAVGCLNWTGQSERQKWGLWLELVQGVGSIIDFVNNRVWNDPYNMYLPDMTVLSTWHDCTEETMSCKMINNFLLAYNNLIQEQEKRSCL